MHAFVISSFLKQNVQDVMADGNHGGCKMLREAVVERVKPSYHVFGHIHEGKQIITTHEIAPISYPLLTAYGVSTNGTTVFINAAICGKGQPSRIKNVPIVFDLPRDKNKVAQT